MLESKNDIFYQTYSNLFRTIQIFVNDKSPEIQTLSLIIFYKFPRICNT